jgi:manganese/zinc/iron transport system substrate-binding protein
MKGFLTFIISALLLSACSSGQKNDFQAWAQPDGRLKVLSTIAMINDLVEQIGGENVSTLTLVKGGLDPHSYQLVKGDDEKLALADLIFCSGLGLEHGPSLREYLEKNSKSTCLGDLIKGANPELVIYLQKTPDPHIWMDVSLWAKAVPFIVAALSQKDPLHADQFKQRGEDLVNRMMAQHAHFQQELAKVPPENRYLVTSHDAFNYFARAYLSTEEERSKGGWQKRFVAPEGLAPESQLSSLDIRQILTHMKAYNIHVIFPESNVNQASIRKLLDAGSEERMRLKIVSESLYGDAMGSPGSEGDTHLKMIQHNVETIGKYLNHNETAAGAKDAAQ